MQFNELENIDSTKKGRARNKKTIVMLVIMVIAITTALAVSAGVLAKYITSQKTEEELESGMFHISSDYLKEGAEVPTYEIYNFGSSGIRINLNNYEMDNIALIAECDIKYSVTVSAGWYCQVFEDGNLQSMINGQYTMSQKDSAYSQVLVLKKTGETVANPNKVEITVRTDSYTREFKAKFNILADTSLNWQVTDQGKNIVVHIETNSYAGTLTVNWNAEKLSPDNNNENMRNWLDSEGTGQIEVTAYTSYDLIFVKKTTDTIEGNGSGDTIEVEIQ